MAESKRETRQRREAQKIFCSRLFSSTPMKLSQKPITPKRLHLDPLILSTFDLVGPEGFLTTPIVQCRICKTILTRPKKRYCNLRKHLHTRYHKRLEKMIYSTGEDAKIDQGSDEETERSKEEISKQVSDSKQDMNSEMDEMEAEGAI